MNNERLEKESDNLMDYLEQLDPNDEKYFKTINAIKDLDSLKEKPKRKWYQVDPETKRTLIVVGGNIMVVLVTLYYERLHTVTSRALNHMIKPRL